MTACFDEAVSWHRVSTYWRVYCRLYALWFWFFVDERCMRIIVIVRLQCQSRPLGVFGEGVFGMYDTRGLDTFFGAYLSIKALDIRLRQADGALNFFYSAGQTVEKMSKRSHRKINSHLFMKRHFVGQ